MPTVSVVLPFHNAEPYLSESVQSILRQSFDDFELLLVDDASTDGSAGIAEELTTTDNRIRLLSNGKNKGLAATLNAAIKEARGEYVARMDADDISLPHRLLAQYTYLQENPEVDLVGGDVRLIGHPNAFWRFPRNDRTIKDMLLVKPSMWHPLYFFRRRAWLDAGLAYDESFSVAQDYDVLTRAAPFLRMANLPEVLLDYRRHSDQVSAKRRAIRMVNTADVAARYVSQTMPEIAAKTENALGLHRKAVAEIGAETLTELDSVLEWLARVLEATASAEDDASMVWNVISRKAYVFCRRSTHLGPSALRRYLASPFLRHNRPPSLSLAKFGLLAVARRNQRRPVPLA
jgi:glycosyltransferase involved in cell wall biosynthesis